jgi:hypothetical protein
MEGVHRDERPNVETAIQAGQDSADVAHAKEESIARPPHTDKDGEPDDGGGAA